MRRYQRILVVVDPSAALAPVLRTAQWLAPEAAAVHLVALLPDDHAHREQLAAALGALERELAHWPTAAAGHAAVATSFEVSFDAARTTELAAQAKTDLIVVGPTRSRSARERVLLLLELSSRGATRVVSVGHGVRSDARRSGLLGLVFQGHAGLASLAVAARELPGFPRVVAFVLGASEAQLEEDDAALRSLLPGRNVEVRALASSALGTAELVEQAAAQREVDLLVVASDAVPGLPTVVSGLLAAQALQDAGRPTVLVPAPAPGARLVASDTLRLPGVPAQLVLERVGPFGRVALPAGARLVLPGSLAHSPLPLQGAVAALPPDWFGAEERLHPLALALEGAEDQLAVCHAVGDQRPVVFVDSRLAPGAFADLEPLAADVELVFVRLRGDEALHELRARLLHQLPWGGPVLIIDAQAWLDDGGGADVPRAADAQRLLRLALKLRALGARASAVVLAAEVHLHAEALEVLSPAALARRRPGSTPRAAPGPVDDALTLLSGARPVGGNHVELELDNGAARRALIEAAGLARQRFHLQSYIVEDDAAVRELYDALVAAAGRGVAVRVLADALYSLHDVFGTSNAALHRLAQTPGVEVRVYQPVSGLPSLADLKQRNHRKLVVVDGTRAWVSGRNLGLFYYRGFDEVRLSPQSRYADVPWVDASARLAGPLVAGVDHAFLADWVRAGGAPFAVATPGPAGGMTCRLVLHDGLVDTRTLDTQLLLVERARERLVLVSTFPLVLELQHALLAAVRRGVQVQLVFGNVRPRWGEGRPFEGGAYRELGDELVRSRLEPVLRAGAEGYEVALAPRPGWSAELGHVYPHVHAKLLVRDGADVAIGSANVDVTSAYWESEALLVVHDQGFAQTTLAALAPVLAEARRVDVGTGDWASQHSRREWLGRHWPSIVG